MGDESQGDAFFESRWPDVAAIADPGQELYAAFGLGSGTMNQVIGPRALLAAGRALVKGHLMGKPVGDVKAMPGAFLIAGRDLLWSHDYLHSGERPDWRAAILASGTGTA